MPLKLLNWNVEWAVSKWKAAELQRRIGQHAADIVRITETDTARLALPDDGHSMQKRSGGQKGGPAVVQRALAGRE